MNHIILALLLLFAGVVNAGNIKIDHGAVGDGTTDDTAAVNACFGDTDKICFMPTGNYLVTSNPNPPTASQIVGDSVYTTTIKAASGVTRVIETSSSSNSHLNKLANFRIIGYPTTANAVGLGIGIGAKVDQVDIDQVTVSGFLGTNSKACHIANTQQSVYISFICGGSAMGQLIEGTINGMPSNITYIGGGSKNTTGIGTKIVTGQNIIFSSNYVFESTGNACLYVKPNQGVSVGPIILDNVWTEDCVSPSDPSNYSLVVDGSNLPALVMFYSKRGNYIGGSGKTKAINIFGSGIVVDLEDFKVTNGTTGEIKIGSGSMNVNIGLARSVAGDYNSLVSDPNGYATNTAKPFGNTYTVSASGIGGANSYNGSYLVVGNYVQFKVAITTSTSISSTAGTSYVSLPSTFPLIEQGSCIVTNAITHIGYGVGGVTSAGCYLPTTNPAAGEPLIINGSYRWQ